MRIRDLLSMTDPAPEVLTAPHLLDEEIRWVHITDLPNPAPYLRGGELILTSGLWYRDPSDVQTFATALESRGVHALGFALAEGDEVPEGLQSACEKSDIVLLALPDVPFMNVTERVITQLLEERHEGSVHAVALGQELTSRLERGEGSSAFIDVLSRQAEAPCWVLHRNAAVTALTDQPLSTLNAVWSEAFDPSTRWQSMSEVVLESGRRLTVVRVWPDGERRALAPPAALVFEASQAAMYDHVATATALAGRYFQLAFGHSSSEQLERRRQITVALGSSNGNGSEYESGEVLAANGVIPDAPLAALVLASGDDTELAADVLESALRLRGISDIAIGTERDRVFALLGVPEQSSSELGQAIFAHASTILRDAVALGLAYPWPKQEAQQVLRQAVQALRVAQMPGRERKWATAADAGSHLLLLADASEGALQTLHEKTVAPLAEYDERYDSELVRTLAVFLDQACSWQRTADELHLHVNSLRYRISRIEKITGRDLSRMTDRVDFFLALASVAG